MEPEKMVGFPEAVVGGTEGGPGPTEVPTTAAAAGRRLWPRFSGCRCPRPYPATTRTGIVSTASIAGRSDMRP